MEAFAASCGVFGGCQVNVFLLELLTNSNNGTYYALTFLQYVMVALLAAPLVFRVRSNSSHGDVAIASGKKGKQEEIKKKKKKSGSWLPWSVKYCGGRLKLSHKIILAVSAWAMSVGSNIVFGFHVSVPLHATFRSSSLLLNMLSGSLFLGKRFTALQVTCAIVITAGLVALTLERARAAEKGGKGGSKHKSTEEETEAMHFFFWQLIGVTILLVTTVLSTALGIFQEYMYRCAHDREASAAAKQNKDKNEKESKDMVPMWAEALFFSHAIGIPLFFLQPTRLFSELAAFLPSNYLIVLFNCLTQYVCVSSVYVLNDKTSAFTLILILTLRKLATFVVSVIYFKHYLLFSVVDWTAMVGAMAAGTLYPFLPKAAASASSSSAAKAVDAAKSTGKISSAPTPTPSQGNKSKNTVNDSNSKKGKKQQ